MDWTQVIASAIVTLFFLTLFYRLGRKSGVLDGKIEANREQIQMEEKFKAIRNLKPIPDPPPKKTEKVISTDAEGRLDAKDAFFIVRELRVFAEKNMHLQNHMSAIVQENANLRAQLQMEREMKNSSEVVQ